METYICYVTGETLSGSRDHFYVFGGRGPSDNIILTLSQESFAHFILRAGKDAKHRKILEGIKVADAALKAAQELAYQTLASTCSGPVRDRDIVRLSGEVQLEILDLNHALNAILIEKAKSGLRILNLLREEHRAANED